MHINDLNRDQKIKVIIQGFVMSVLLLSFAAILYNITFNHAEKLDPMLYDVKIPIIDDKIPAIPVFFFGYNLGFIYWFFASFFIVLTGKKKTYKFIVTFVITIIICNLILYFFPAKLDRVAEGLYDPSHTGFLWKLMHICYSVDGGFVGYNLLPSTHCANSILFYQAMKDDVIDIKFQRVALVSTIIVIVSTLLTKQHYFIDVVAGVLIPIIMKSIIDKIWRQI